MERKTQFYKKIDLPFELKNVSQEGVFSGYASVFNIIDSENDQVLPGAFLKSLHLWKSKGKMPKILWQHNAQEPIGICLELREDGHGLYVKGQLLLQLSRAWEAYALLKAQGIEGLSIGYHVKSAVQDPSLKTRVLKEIDLQEISLVTFAANPAAQVMHLACPEDLPNRIPKIHKETLKSLHSLIRTMQNHSPIP